jgi:hypothetical protein
LPAKGKLNQIVCWSRLPDWKNPNRDVIYLHLVGDGLKPRLPTAVPLAHE